MGKEGQEAGGQRARQGQPGGLEGALRLPGSRANRLFRSCCVAADLGLCAAAKRLGFRIRTGVGAHPLGPHSVRVCWGREALGRAQ